MENQFRVTCGSRKVYEICRKHDKLITIMEPIKGGSLASVDCHPEIADMFKAADPTQSACDWALRYAASLDGVVTVLSGMSTLEQMEKNIKTLGNGFKPLTEDENDMLRRAAEYLESLKPVGCTACHYCVDSGCPAGIAIPAVLESLNMLNQYKDMRTARLKYYQNAMYGKKGPQDCLACGKCEASCPQKLPIRELLQQAKNEFDLGNHYDAWANQ